MLVSAQGQLPRATLRRPVAVGVSLPVRELAKLPSKMNWCFPEENESLQQPVRNHPSPIGSDPVEQTSPSGQNLPISVLVNVPGMKGSNPCSGTWVPDTNAAVGDNVHPQVVEFVNDSFQVFSKSGQALTQPMEDNLLFSSLPSSNCYQYSGGDIIVDFDKANHVWLLAWNIGQVSNPYPACIAVSTSSDATSTFYIYEYNLNTRILPDYPKWGIWPTGYFQVNEQPGGGTGPLVCAYNGAKLRVNDHTAEQVCVTLPSADFQLLPADVDSTIPPPSGQAEFFIGSIGRVDDPACNLGGSGPYNTLFLYSMAPDFPNGTATFVGAGEANPICVPAYTTMCLTACVPQAGNTGQELDTLGNTVMFRFAYWNNGPPVNVTATALGHFQHWYVNHVVQASGTQAGVRWYEFESNWRVATINNVALHQSGTFAPDSNYRWMGSIAGDKNGDIALGYSESSSTMYPSIYVTGQISGDPEGQMRNEYQLVAGTGAKEGDGNSRWGDYSSMAVDPYDGHHGCTFWYAQEYYVATGGYWYTQLVAFTLNGCQ